MGTMEGNRIGLAGEFRVMSELLLRGHNPAKSYLENGADLVLENGIRVEVKSAHRCNVNRTTGYLFSLKGGHRGKRQDLDSCDFLICWCIDDDCFYIVPKSEVTKTEIGIYNTSPNANHKYASYREKWEILERR